MKTQANASKSMLKRRKLGSACALALALSAALAGCGSAASGSKSSETLKVYDLGGWNGPAAGVYAPWKSVASAAADEINASGGVKGHHVEVIFCDTTGTAAGNAECGRKAASDSGTIGIINFTTEATAYLTYAERAKIPVAGPLVNQEELNSPQMFGLTAQNVGIATSLPALGKLNGCKRMSYVIAGQGAKNATDRKKYFDNATKSLGLESASFSTESVPDMSPVIARALESNPDCIAVDGLGPDWPAMVNAIDQSGKPVTIFAHCAQIPADIAKSLSPSVLTKVKVVSEGLPPTAKGQGNIDAFNAAVEKYSSVKGDAAKDGNSVLQYSLVHMFAKAAELAKDPMSPASVTAALKGFHDYVSGTVPPISFDEPADNPVGPHLFQKYMFQVKFQAGQALPVLVSPKSFNIFTGAEGPTVSGS
jgi:ABC-type branched-subunit amino acid transport system substrate-binding protein